ncbi:MAG TPA: FtsX-like permease family protein [Steroidobacteraceae bacterium]|nr:FtsX-like permease family protein [Steroidobacteraceae bacterium]
MDILPVLSALRRHRLVMWLLILEVALTCSIVSNAVFLITSHIERTRMPSGIAEHELALVEMADISVRPNGKERPQTELAALQQIPGVKQVALANGAPFASGSNTDVRVEPHQRRRSLNTGLFFGKNLLPALGTRLIAGRRFLPEEFTDLSQALAALANDEAREFPHVTIVTQAVAQRLWPGQPAVGKMVYVGKDIPLQVVGVIESLTRPAGGLFQGAEYSMVLPINADTSYDANKSNGLLYLLRCAPQDRTRVLKAAVATLKQLDPNRVLVRARTFDQVRDAYFQNDRALAGTLVGVCLALLIVTALGIVGLASFWVAQRRKLIGVRRALGATRGDILRYFQTENFLIVTAGIVLGTALAFALNLELMRFNAMARLPWVYLPIGAVALWCLGQIAILGPALRAANVPPVVATRSV